MNYTLEDRKEMRGILKSSNTHLKVSEIFTTIQGEGPSTGIPVVFVRLSLCNLRCSWCDTPYTWNWEGTNFKHDTKDYEQSKYDPRKEIILMTPSEIYHKVQELAGYNVDRVILTGGEPLVQQNNPAFIEMLDIFVNDLMLKVEVETNGTLIPTENVYNYITQFNVSPKLENSGNILQMRRRSEAYRFFVSKVQEFQDDLYRDVFFKFVVAHKDDIIEIEELIKDYSIPRYSVLLMPEGRTDEETRARSQEIVKICIEKGYRFCNRLQVWIWDGALRGV